MKIRMGFVSNSSSSSFVLERRYISEYQLEQIQNHIAVAKEFNSMRQEVTDEDDYDMPETYYCECSDYDKWDISVTDTTVKGYTSMNNFDMEQFMRQIGVDPAHVEFESN